MVCLLRKEFASNFGLSALLGIIIRDIPHVVGTSTICFQVEYESGWIPKLRSRTDTRSQPAEYRDRKEVEISGVTPFDQNWLLFFRDCWNHRLYANFVHYNPLDEESDGAPHFASFIWDRVTRTLYIFDTLAFSPEGKLRIAGFIHLWKQLLRNSGRPVDFDFVVPPISEQPESWECGYLAFYSLWQTLRGLVGLRGVDATRIFEGCPLWNVPSVRPKQNPQLYLRDWAQVPRKTWMSDNVWLKKCQEDVFLDIFALCTHELGIVKHQQIRNFTRSSKLKLTIDNTLFTKLGDLPALSNRLLLSPRGGFYHFRSNTPSWACGYPWPEYAQFREFPTISGGTWVPEEYFKLPDFGAARNRVEVQPFAVEQKVASVRAQRRVASGGESPLFIGSPAMSTGASSSGGRSPTSDVSMASVARTSLFGSPVLGPPIGSPMQISTPLHQGTPIASVRARGPVTSRPASSHSGSAFSASPVLAAPSVLRSRRPQPPRPAIPPSARLPSGDPPFFVSGIRGARVVPTRHTGSDGNASQRFSDQVGPAGRAMTIDLAEAFDRHGVFTTTHWTTFIPETETYATLRPRGLVSLSAWTEAAAANTAAGSQQTAPYREPGGQRSSARQRRRAEGARTPSPSGPVDTPDTGRTVRLSREMSNLGLAQPGQRGGEDRPRRRR